MSQISHVILKITTKHFIISDDLYLLFLKFSQVSVIQRNGHLIFTMKCMGYEISCEMLHFEHSRKICIKDYSMQGYFVKVLN